MFIVSLVLMLLFGGTAQVQAWNKPGHMLSGAIAYQILRQESPETISKVRAILEQHPWFETHWKRQLRGTPQVEQDQRLFMLAARWPDDARGTSFHRSRWHYINLPFKPAGEPDHVVERPPERPNALEALKGNEIVLKTNSSAERQAIALAWLFHLIGDVHQPLHASELFTTEYPDGDQGGNEICIQVRPDTRIINLHSFWDGLMVGTANFGQLANFAVALRNRGDLAKANLAELGPMDFETWIRESAEQATAVAYRNGLFRGSPKGHADECSDLGVATILPTGYLQAAKHVAYRRMVIAGYRLADFLKGI